jgi:hypothetical protein
MIKQQKISDKKQFPGKTKPPNGFKTQNHPHKLFFSCFSPLLKNKFSATSTRQKSMAP